jgi:BASS family bile acid:Na+ symporter
MADGINHLLLISVMSLLLSVGLRTTFGAVLAVAKQYQLVLRGVAANFLVVPFVFFLALQRAPFGPDVVIGLLTLAAVPVAPLAPPFVGMARGNLPYAVGLMLIVALLCVPLTPLILTLSLPTSAAGLQIDPLKIIQTLLTAQLIPLGLGMTINHIKQGWQRHCCSSFPRLGRSVSSAVWY